MRTPQWLQHFSLKEAPFSKDLEDKDLWMPSSKKDLVDDLVDTIAARQHAVIVGEPGVGKTCTLRALRARLPESEFRLTYCHNASLGLRDFYRQLCFTLGLPTKGSAAGVFWALTNHVQKISRDRQHPVFLIDEAQLLRDDVLKHLHVLTNYAWDQKPLLSIVLVGLPELGRRLSLGAHRSLWTRIQCRVAIEQPSPDDTAEYIRYRVERVGGKSTLFAINALGILHEATAGQLRDIDRVATASLRAAARRKLKNVSLNLLQDVLDADALLD